MMRRVHVKSISYQKFTIDSFLVSLVDWSYLLAYIEFWK